MRKTEAEHDFFSFAFHPRHPSDGARTKIRWREKREIDQNSFEKLGSEAHPSTPAEFRKFMTEQTAVWSEVVKKGHIQVEN